MPCQPLHASIGLHECQLSLPLQSLTTIYKHGKGEVGSQLGESAAAAAGALGLCKVLCWLPLIASRNTPFLPSSARQELHSFHPPVQATDPRTATVHPHWCHSGLLGSLGLLCYTRWRLITTNDCDQLLMTSQSSIILLSDRGKP